MKKKVSLIIVPYKRVDALRETIESLEGEAYDELILVDNCPESGTRAYAEPLAEANDKIKYFPLEENLGVAGGRNYGVNQATGDILVFLDDDAVFKERGYFSKILDVFEKDEKIGALAFQIINFYTGEMQRKEIPFTDKNLDMEQERLTSTFIGAGHAIRREVFDKCGYFPDNFFYGGEELDLSFRIIAAGYKILYFPTVKVLHKQAISGRFDGNPMWKLIYRNRLLTAYSYLPLYYRVASAGIWGAKVLIKSKNPKILFEAIQMYRDERKNCKRIKLSKEALQYMRKNYGRLWY